MVNFWGTKQNQAQSNPQEANNASWYSPSAVSSSSSSCPETHSSNSSGSFNVQSPTNRPSSVSSVSHAEASGIIDALKNKSVNELKKLVSDKDAYQNFLLSLEAVKTQNNAHCSMLISSVVKSACFVALSTLKSEAQGCCLYWLKREAMEEAQASTTEV